MTTHRLELQHRGAQHRHPWLARCVCGWAGVARRRRRTAEEQYRAHVNGQTDGHANRVGVFRRTRREPTPLDRLPEELRAC